MIICTTLKEELQPWKAEMDMFIISFLQVFCRDIGFKFSLLAEKGREEIWLLCKEIQRWLLGIPWYSLTISHVHSAHLVMPQFINAMTTQVLSFKLSVECQLPVITQV